MAAYICATFQLMEIEPPKQEEDMLPEATDCFCFLFLFFLLVWEMNHGYPVYKPHWRDHRLPDVAFSLTLIPESHPEPRRERMYKEKSS